MSTVATWYGCDLVSGQIVEELPDLAPAGPVSHLLGNYTSAAFRLPIPLGGHGEPPKNWQAATAVGRTMIVGVLNDQPIWGGIVLPRKRGTEATAQLSCVSLEGYLNRRYVGDHKWVQQDIASVIAAGLIGDAQVEGINFTIDAPPMGELHDREYKDQDDAKVFSRLRELMGVDGGPEWTIMLAWNAQRTGFVKTFVVRKRIGVVSTTPTAVFTTGSASAVVASQGASEGRYTFDEDYSEGRGANHIVATSSGEGDSRPQSPPARDETLLAGGWPRYEYRFSPSSSISDVDTLTGHAQQALALQRLGAQTITITARADADPILGTHWFVGDDIGYDLVGHGHPDGLRGVARAIGWHWHPLAGTVSPILLDRGSP